MGWCEGPDGLATYVLRLDKGSDGHPTRHSLARVMGVLVSMPPADRIALARELLAGTGWVPAREVEEKFGFGMTDWDDGWNACRAAMLGEEP